MKKSILELLKKIDKNKEIVIVGAGKYGRYLAKEFSVKKRTVLCFFDNDITKEGTKVAGIEVKKPYNVKNENVVYVISVAMVNIRRELFIQLEKMGINSTSIYIYYPMADNDYIKEHENIRWIRENKYMLYDVPYVLDMKKISQILLFQCKKMYYKILLNIFKPQYKEKKYKVSICAIFRDEAPYLREWIEYHSIVGVEHFYLYNNFSKDNFMEVLRPYIESGRVTLQDWPYKLSQMEAYADCVEKYKEDTNWIGFIDLDEFVVPNKTDSIGKFLDKFKNRPSVVINWKCFGTSGIMVRNMDSLVIEDFTISHKKYMDIGKFFFNTGYDYWEKSKQYMHLRWVKYKDVKLPPVNVFGKVCIEGFNPINRRELPIQINHYLLKSYQEFCERKMKHGGGVFNSWFHNLEYFNDHERKCCSVDYNIYKYVMKTKIAIKMSSEKKGDCYDYDKQSSKGI